MTIEVENGILPSHPQTRRITARLSDAEYQRLCEIAEARWEYPISLNSAIKRMIRTFYMGDEIMKRVKR